jgi:hypothetical protein
MDGFFRFPDTHRSSGRFAAVMQDGTRVILEIANTSRPIRGHEIVKAHIAMHTGRGFNTRVDETSIALFVGRRPRMQIEITQSGQYRNERSVNRSLRSLVKEMVQRVAPQVDPGDEPEESPRTFSR